ncbi:MAG: hypothetical protein ACI360_08600 [Atopobiaceae bacterium]
MSAQATIEAGGQSLTFWADRHSGLMLGALDGWYGTPQAKVDLTARKVGYGDYDVQDEDVLYAARTVTMDVCADGENRATLVQFLDMVDQAAGQVVTLIVQDDDGSGYTTQPTYVRGYVEVDWDKGPARDSLTGTVTVVCPDPRRYGTTRHAAYLRPSATGQGGLRWNASSGAISWPLNYGTWDSGTSNWTTVHNYGTTRAYPTITCHGSVTDLTINDVTNGGQLRIGGYLGWQKVELDCLNRVATVAGADCTRRLTLHHFPSIPAGGDLTLALGATTGAAIVEVSWRDTYI